MTSIGHQRVKKFHNARIIWHLISLVYTMDVPCYQGITQPIFSELKNEMNMAYFVTQPISINRNGYHEPKCS